jgi:hypothetical protein
METDLGLLYEALAAAQGEGMAAMKDSTGQIGQQKTRYADLASCWEACRKPLANHGLCVTQLTSADGQRVTVTTILGHKSGQSLSASLTMTSATATPQALGSTITYARRYALCSMVGIAPEDDDGTAGSGGGGSKEAAKLVAKDKLTAMGKTEEAETLEKQLTDSVDFEKMMKGFREIKGEFEKLGALGEYYEILNAAGFQHSNKIRPASAARPIYKTMASALGTLKNLPLYGDGGEELPDAMSQTTGTQVLFNLDGKIQRLRVVSAEDDMQAWERLK